MTVHCSGPCSLFRFLRHLVVYIIHNVCCINILHLIRRLPALTFCFNHATSVSRAIVKPFITWKYFKKLIYHMTILISALYFSALLLLFCKLLFCLVIQQSLVIQENRLDIWNAAGSPLLFYNIKIKLWVLRPQEWGSILCTSMS